MQQSAQVLDMQEFIIKRHVKNFILAYNSQGKLAAGLLLKEVPKQYKDEVVSRLTTILKLK